MLYLHREIGWYEESDSLYNLYDVEEPHTIQSIVSEYVLRTKDVLKSQTTVLEESPYVKLVDYAVFDLPITIYPTKLGDWGRAPRTKKIHCVGYDKNLGLVPYEEAREGTEITHEWKRKWNLDGKAWWHCIFCKKNMSNHRINGWTSVDEWAIEGQTFDG